MMVGVRLAAVHASVRFGSVRQAGRTSAIFYFGETTRGGTWTVRKFFFNCMFGVGGRLSDDGRVTMRVVRARFGWAEAGKRLSAATVTR